jgi:hypothetical protein
VAAHSGAQSVVRSFYDWYMRAPGAAVRFAEPGGPVEGWFDEELIWMLRQERESHPLAKPHRAYECQLDADPFGLGNAGARVARFVMRGVRRRGDLYVVPIALYLVLDRPHVPMPPINMAVAVKKQNGRYMIYDFGHVRNGTYEFGLRSGLTQMARNPKCAWSH